MNDREIDKVIKDGYKNKLKSKLYGLLQEYEKNRNWESFLDSILIELGGFTPEQKTINYYTLCHKLAFSRYMSHKYFRKTIFDCMSLIEKIEV